MEIWIDIVEIKLEINDIVTKIRDCLYPMENIVFAILYGSAAKGIMHIDSDIDVAIFVTNGLGIDDKIDLIYRLAKCLNICEDKIDLVSMGSNTPLELRYKIFRDGILIFSRDTRLYKQYRDESVSMYLDLKIALRATNYNKKYLERLREELDGIKK